MSDKLRKAVEEALIIVDEAPEYVAAYDDECHRDVMQPMSLALTAVGNMLRAALASSQAESPEAICFQENHRCRGCGKYHLCPTLNPPSSQASGDVAGWLRERANDRAWSRAALQHESTVLREAADAWEREHPATPAAAGYCDRCAPKVENLAGEPGHEACLRLAPPELSAALDEIFAPSPSKQGRVEHCAECGVKIACSKCLTPLCPSCVESHEEVCEP